MALHDDVGWAGRLNDSYAVGAFRMSVALTAPEGRRSADGDAAW